MALSLARDATLTKDGQHQLDSYTFSNYTPAQI